MALEYIPKHTKKLQLKILIRVTLLISETVLKAFHH